MPLVDWLHDKWRDMRAERLRGEESRRQVFESLNAQEKDRACQKIAQWLKQADIKAENTVNSDDWYYSQAQQKIAGFRWQLHRLNRPFIWLEKQIIEPLDFWSDRANVFQFFAKVSPLLEAIGVLAIPFVIFYYESQREERQLEFEKQREERQLEFEKQREERQIEFEQNLISAQSEVRKQQAVRDYLSQITIIYLDVENRDKIKQDEDLKKFLEATTLAIFNELSVSEDFQGKSNDSSEFNDKAIESDRKGEVIDFLSKLGWIIGEEPLLSLEEANLSQANLSRADLRGADLSFAKLRGANLSRADLRGADLSFAKLRGADLRGANLSRADLSVADLSRADLSVADLRGANLNRADLNETIFCKTTMPDDTTNNSDCK